MRKVGAAAVAAAAVAVMQTITGLACGALVAPDGSVRLGQATTLVAWHDGVEHYLTSFTYAGATAGDFGYIVPLPAAPIRPVVEGGAWTLQRLEREVAPPVQFGAASATAARAASPATVLQTARVAALDISVIRGTGPAILSWCGENGFVLPAETRDHLLRYARATPYFLAAKYDLARAQHQGLLSGEGTPVLITMRTASLWVPLEVLAEDGQPVDADLFLLTDSPISTGQENVLLPTPGTVRLPGAPGFTLVRSEPMRSSLFHDLSSDRNMGWVWRSSTLTYLTLRAPGASVTYDLGVSPGGALRLASFATPPALVPARLSGPFAPNPWMPWVPLLALLGAVTGATLITVRLIRGAGEPPAP